MFKNTVQSCYFSKMAILCFEVIISSNCIIILFFQLCPTVPTPQVYYSVYPYVTNDLILQFIISILFTISMAHPEALRKKVSEDLTRQDRQVNQEINEPDDLLAVENIISEVIHPPPPPGMKTRQNI